MNSRDASPTFEFADSSSPVGPGRKHRRVRGNVAKNSRKAPSAAGTGGAAIGTAATGMSHQLRGGFKNAPSPSVVSNLGGDHQSMTHHYLHQQPQTHANYYTSDAWDNVGSPRCGLNNMKDDNSCTGSLTYSASSSVQSAESSNDSSFADIIKLIDSSDGGGAALDVNKIILKKSRAATSGGDSLGKETAVFGWMQGAGDRRRSQHKTNETEQIKKKTKKSVFTMSKHAPTSGHVEFNYSKDDNSDSEDVFGVDFDEKILETIAGHDDNIARTLVTSQPNHKHEEYEIYSSKTTPTRSASSTPRGHLSGHMTPPPNSRSKRTSSPPGEKEISRTNSRNSKSSSDGSFDTPAPSSPPSTKPPHATRSSSVTKLRGRAGKEDETAVEDLSQAFYAKSWMCGFADAFNFYE